jgi:hypothetical protein
MTLPTFEDYDGKTKRAKKWGPWLLIRIFQCTKKKPITASKIEVMTTKKYMLSKDEINDRETYTITANSRNLALKNIKKAEGLRAIEARFDSVTNVHVEDGVMKALVKVQGLSGPEVRAIVSYLRSVHRYPIGSGGMGYFWIRTIDEKETTMDHLRGRRNAIDAALQGVENCDLAATVTAHLDVSEPSLFDDFMETSETPWGAADEIKAPELVIGTDAILAELDKHDQEEK